MHNRDVAAMSRLDQLTMLIGGLFSWGKDQGCATRNDATQNDAEKSVLQHRGLNVKTNYVLVDYENVQVKSLSLLKGEQFRVRIFLGPNNKKLPVELVLAMQELGERAEYTVLEKSGANALDFYIAYYLGIFSAADPLGIFHIISNDTGFDPLIKHLKTKKIFCLRSKSIEDMPCFSVAPKKEVVAKVNAADPKQKSVPAQQSVEMLITKAIGDLAKRKESRPRTSKTLLNTIHTTCGKDLPISQIQTVYEGLVKRGYVTVSGTKVSYSLPTMG